MGWSVPGLAREFEIWSVAGAVRGGRHRPGMGQRPYIAFATGVMGVKRLTSPPSGSHRITERLPHGMSVGSSRISGTVWGTRPLTCSQVSSTRSSMKTERFWPGTGAALPSIPDGRGGADGDGPGRGLEFSEGRDGPG